MIKNNTFKKEHSPPWLVKVVFPEMINPNLRKGSADKDITEHG
jgi:hypothetical protein